VNRQIDSKPFLKEVDVMAAARSYRRHFQIFFFCLMFPPSMVLGGVLFDPPDEAIPWTVNVGSTKQLFLDDRLIVQAQNVGIYMAKPEKYVGNPVVIADQPWEQNQEGGTFHGVQMGMQACLYDKEDQCFKMWYNAINWDRFIKQTGKEVSPWCYATSKDGYHWEKPELGIVECDGSTANNIVGVFPQESYAAVIKTPHDPDPQRRYKGFGELEPKGQGEKHGACVAFSPDGIHWTRYEGNPVIKKGPDFQTVRTLWGGTLGLKNYTIAEQEEYKQAIEFDRLRELKGKMPLDSDQEKRFNLLEARNPRKEFSYINEPLLIWIICTIVFVYAVAGGLEAAVYTDMLQGIFIIILSLILIPFGMMKINTVFGSSGILGAFQEMHRRLPEWYFDIFGSDKSPDFTWYYIVALSIMATINVGVQATQLNAYGSAKDELTARIGATTGCFMKRFCTVLWGFLGLIAVTLYTGQLTNSDYVWGHATRDLLGSLGIGLVGLMIASLLAALMSSTDMVMITASGLLTRNVYQQIFPRFSEAHYVRTGRILGGVVLIGAVLVATWFDTILQLLKFLWEFNIILAASFWCGMKWRRANRYGAWCSMIFTLICFSLLPMVLPAAIPSLCEKTSLLKQTDPAPYTRMYMAREMDVDARKEQIRIWQQHNQLGRAASPCPAKLEVGEQITKVIQPPRKALFWSKGIKIENETLQGDGFFYLELYVLDQLWDLSRNPYALNETIRTLIRTFAPFVIMILVSLLTPADTSERLKRFYVKMRTPVLADREKDQQELERSYANLERFQEQLLFPRTKFELFKWNKNDSIGFGLAVLMVFCVLGFMYMLLHIGL